MFFEKAKEVVDKDIILMDNDRESVKNRLKMENLMLILVNK